MFQVKSCLMEGLSPGWSLFVGLADPWPFLPHFLLTGLAILWLIIKVEPAGSMALHMGLYIWEWWDWWWWWGESFALPTLSRTIIVLGASLTSLVFGRDAETKRSSLSLGFWKARTTWIVILQWLGISPDWDPQGLVMLNFQKRCQSPKKKSSEWLSVA